MENELHCAHSIISTRRPTSLPSDRQQQTTCRHKGLSS